MSEPQLPPRPPPPRRAGDVLKDWLAWFGVGRLALAALSVSVVVGGLFWLVRTEPPPVEATLPLAAPTPSIPEPTIEEPTVPGSTIPGSPPVRSAGGSVVVHVAGAVVAPGVYELADGARVDDAVRIAGGPESDAELDGLNLAAPVVDGQRVYVPVVGEIDPASLPSLPTPGGAVPSGPLDLNTATVDELDALPGVGPATASAIVDDRERNGPFAAVEDLERVPGIGPAKLAALRDLVTV